MARDRWLRLLCGPRGAEHAVPRRGRRIRLDICARQGVPAGRRPSGCRAQDPRHRARVITPGLGAGRTGADGVLAGRRGLAQGNVVTEAVLFDFNGVLVDDESQHCEALQRVLAAEGITLTREQYYANYLGLDDRSGFVEAYRRAQRTVTTELLQYLVAKKSQLYLELVATSLRLVEGAPEFVRDAGQRFRLGIVSGASRREIDHVLGKTGLRPSFEIIIAADDLARCKPDPAPYLAAHKAFDAKRRIAVDACVVIEDSVPGLQAARAAGMACVMLTTNHPSRTLEGRGAALLWSSFAGHSAGELAGL
ncbi:MAG: HAD family phosphatase [Betaproteobacteria bacterium]|nr:MAG: HAD family phosphatase [Betaproteobacteria bacterium]